jgi:hypothetical protein
MASEIRPDLNGGQIEGPGAKLTACTAGPIYIHFTVRIREPAPRLALAVLNKITGIGNAQKLEPTLRASVRLLRSH